MIAPKHLSLLYCFVMLSAFCGTLYSTNFTHVIATSLFSLVVLLFFHRKEISKLSPFGGYPNWVTFLRYIAIVAVLIHHQNLSSTTVFLALLLIILLDGLDGILARKLNQSSRFGAIFDMETDAFLVASLSVLLYQKGTIEGWILVPGLMRYFYVLLIYIAGVQNKNESLHPYSKHFAVAFFFGLLIPFVLQNFISNALLIIASSGIMFSFSYSFFKRF